MTTTPVETPVDRASGDTCVYVVGMHRSGTSATTEVLARLGLTVPAADDLIPATGSNQQGHWESRRLVGHSERVLGRLGAAWSSPPELAPAWERDPGLDDLRTLAADLVPATFAAPPMAWKDPRLCVLLPFWRSVVPWPEAALLVTRSPAEVARSLTRRNGFPPILGLALWERYMRAACANLQGIPTLVVDYQRMLDDPGGFGDALVAFLGDAGVTVPASGVDRVAGALDRGLQHQRIAEAPAGLPDSASKVTDALEELDGAHHPWRTPALGPEPAWVAEVLAMRRDYDVLARAHKWATTSRAYRLARWARGQKPTR